MPFKSKAQTRWMYANKPKMAKKWAKHTPKGKRLPEHVENCGGKGGKPQPLHALVINYQNNNQEELALNCGGKGGTMGPCPTGPYVQHLDANSILLRETGQKSENIKELENEIGDGPIHTAITAYKNASGIHIIDGHHRVLAARKKGLAVPAIVMSEEEYHSLKVEGYDDNHIKLGYARRVKEKPVINFDTTLNCGGKGGKPGPCKWRITLDGIPSQEFRHLFLTKLKAKKLAKLLTTTRPKVQVGYISDRELGFTTNCGGKGGKPGPCPLKSVATAKKLVGAQQVKLLTKHGISFVETDRDDVKQRGGASYLKYQGVVAATKSATHMAVVHEIAHGIDATLSSAKLVKDRTFDEHTYWSSEALKTVLQQDRKAATPKGAVPSWENKAHSWSYAFSSPQEAFAHIYAHLHGDDTKINGISIKDAMPKTYKAVQDRLRAAGLTTNAYSSTQLEITDELALQRIKSLQEKLDPADVVELEEHPHITVKYGLHTATPEDVVETMKDWGPIWVTIGRLSLFSTESDVLKLSVQSLGLENLNRQLGLLPHTDTHPVYQPHMTIAYLKPGTGAKYLLDPSLLEWESFVFTKLTFSTPERDHTELSLNAKANCGIGSGGFKPGNTCAKNTKFEQLSEVSDQINRPATKLLNAKSLTEKKVLATRQRAIESTTAEFETILKKNPHLRGELKNFLLKVEARRVGINTDQLGTSELATATIAWMVAAWDHVPANLTPYTSALQKSVQRVFKLKDVPPLHPPAAEDYKELLDAMVTAMYQATQKSLKKAGVREVILHRGWQGEDVNTSKVKLHPLSSFSLRPSVAQGYATLGLDDGMFHTTIRVPASKVFSTPITGIGHLDDHEVIVLGGKQPSVTKRLGVTNSLGSNNTEIALNCGGKGGKPGPCPTQVAATQSSADRAASLFGLSSLKVREVTDDSGKVYGEHSESGPIVVNPHLGQSRPIEINFKTAPGITTATHIAAHETIHRAYSKDPEIGHELQDELSRVKALYGSGVSVYGAFAGKFENLIELGAVYSHSPKELKAYSPEMYAIADKWSKSLRDSQVHNSDYSSTQLEITNSLNPLGIDPTRTVTLRKAFATEMTKRFERIKGEILRLIVDEDAFGLKQQNQVFAVNVFCPGEKGSGVDPTCSPKAGKNLEKHLSSLKGEFAKVAQEEYDAWEQDKDGMDEECGSGGICDRVSQRIQEVIVSKIPQVDIHDGGQDGDDHAWTIVRVKDKAYGVDISPGVYETGAGYNWKKRSGVKIKADDVDIFEVDVTGIDDYVGNCGGKGGKPGPCPWKSSDIKLDSHQEQIAEGYARYTFPGKGKMEIDYDPVKKSIHIGWLGADDPGDESQSMSNFVGLGNLKLLAKRLKQDFPEAVTVTGWRVGGSRKNRRAVVTRPLSQFIHNLSGVFSEHVQNVRWSFVTMPEKVDAFNKWLKRVILKHVISEDHRVDDDWWTAYAWEGFKKGAGRTFDDVKKAGTIPTEKLDWYKGTREQFLKSSFAQPVAIEKVKLLAGRVYTDLAGVTDAMATTMARTLTDGLVQGKGPREIARDLNKNVKGIGQQRANTIARTEIVRAHAEGQLQAMEELGIDEVTAAIEWNTAGDLKVCSLCRPLNGLVLKLSEARNMLPRHPNCRCAWLPANVGEDQRGQKRSLTQIKKAIAKSLGKSKTPWFGKNKRFSKSRPRNITRNQLFKVGNVFCPTGEGGGVDASCSPGGNRVKQTNTPEFKAWFKDSKVVDAKGNPLVVYHGTTAQFTSFEHSHIGDNFETDRLAQSGAWGRGFYFTDSTKQANAYASDEIGPKKGSSIVPVYLSIQNPLVLDWKSSSPSEWSEDAKRFRDMSGIGTDTRAATAWAIKQGYDGVIIREKTNFDEVVAFHPHQIKSAIGNKGKFDPNSPSIINSRELLRINQVLNCGGKGGKPGPCPTLLDDLPNTHSPNDKDDADNPLYQKTTRAARLAFDKVTRLGRPDEQAEIWKNAPIKSLPVTQLISFQASIQPRHVKKLMKVPATNLPPIQVLQRGKKFWIVDGNTRAVAALVRGDKNIKVRLKQDRRMTTNELLRIGQVLNCGGKGGKPGPCPADHVNDILTKLSYRWAGKELPIDQAARESCNEGGCDILAGQLRKRLPGSSIEAAMANDGQGHVWVKFQGKHYDAEHPEGVYFPQQLSFFSRHEGMVKQRIRNVQNVRTVNSN